MKTDFYAMDLASMDKEQFLKAALAVEKKVKSEEAISSREHLILMCYYMLRKPTRKELGYKNE